MSWGKIYCDTNWGENKYRTAGSIINEATPDCFQFPEFVSFKDHVRTEGATYEKMQCGIDILLFLGRSISITPQSPDNPTFSGILDTYTGATAGYSTRRLTNTYTGGLIRVRRSSDDSEQDIGYDANGEDMDIFGLLAFVGSENLFFPSETFTAWGNIGGSTITSNTTDTNDPFGGSNATKVVAGSSVLIYKGTFTNVTRTQSCYAKAGTCETFGIYFGSGFSANFNISESSPSVTSTNNTSATITAVGNGWYRCTATLTSLPTSDYYAGINFSPSSGSTFYIFGAQLEGGTTATTYNPTTTGIGGDGAVTTFYDQTGNGNNATNSTASEQTLVVSGGTLVTENGKAAIDFDGVDDYLTLGGTNDAGMLGDISIFSVNKASSNSGVVIASGLTNSSSASFMQWGINLQTSNQYMGSTSDGTTRINESVTATNYGSQVLVSMINDEDGNLQMFADGVGSSGQTAVAPMNDAAYPLEIGRDPWRASLNFEGTQQELILFASDQSSNRTGIEGNINNYFSIYTP